MVPVKLHPDDNRSVRLTFGPYILTPVEAQDFARELLEQASYARELPSIHERHVDLLASCALCVHEAGSQPDRLTYDDEPEPIPDLTAERFETLAIGRWAMVEQRVGITRQKRTLFGNVDKVRVFNDRVTEVLIIDKEDRMHWVDISKVDRMSVNAGGNGMTTYTLVENGEVGKDYWIAR